MKLNSPKQKLNTKNQSLSGCPSFSTQNSECYNPVTTFSLTFVMYTSSKLEMDTDSLSRSCREGTGRLYPTRKESSESLCGQTIAPIVSKLMQSQTSSPEGAVTSTKEMTRQHGLFKEDFRCTEMLCLSS